MSETASRCWRCESRIAAAGSCALPGSVSLGCASPLPAALARPRRPSTVNPTTSDGTRTKESKHPEGEQLKSRHKSNPRSQLLPVRYTPCRSRPTGRDLRDVGAATSVVALRSECLVAVTGPRHRRLVGRLVGTCGRFASERASGLIVFHRQWSVSPSSASRLRRFVTTSLVCGSRWPYRSSTVTTLVWPAR